MKVLIANIDLAILERKPVLNAETADEDRPNPAPVDPDTRREIGPTVLSEERVRGKSDFLYPETGH